MKKLFKLLILLLFITFRQSAECSGVSIKGDAPSYKNDIIRFYTYNNYITYSEKTLCSARVDENGKFECSFNSENTIQIVADIGIFQGFLYVEPGKSYDVVLPEKVEKELKDKVNPYFEPVQIQLGIKGADENELNMLIRMFNDTYIPYFNKHVVNVVTQNDLSALEQDIKKITGNFKSNDNAFLNKYIDYRIGLLQFLAQQNKAKKTSENLFNSLQSIQYYNPAYMELFNQIFNKYFTYIGRTEKNNAIYTIINQDKSYNKLDALLSKEKELSNKTFREFVILKNLYDEFYSGNFSRSAMLDILDTLINKTQNDIHRETGRDIKNKVTRLLAGYAPPSFSLYNQDSLLVTLDDFKGKYVYLNFCSGHGYTCIQEYETLKYLYEKHHKYLEIITISTDITYEAMVKYRDQSKCPWTFLYFGNQPEIIEQYDIRAVPMYYFIGKNGKLLMSPAPSPGENFEKFLFETMRKNGDI